MAKWHSSLARVLNGVEDRFDVWKYRLASRLGGPDPIMILPYRGYGRPDLLYLKGRVLENRGELTATDNDTLWRNLVNMYKRLESDEIPGARLIASFQGVEEEVVANEEGFFDVFMRPKEPLPPGEIWQKIHLRLVSPQPRHQSGPVEAVGEVFVPPPTARFVVVSDIDDTVLRSDATQLIKMARNVFMGNARTRLPFPGVAAFYRALLDGLHGNDINPLFYVSSSPWNLYDLLADFFHLQGIPHGPILFLRDWGLTETEILPLRSRDYKVGVVRQMLEFYPDLPFILIGDSGQEDPEIYKEITASYPDRIMAVYIRNVSRDLKRPAAIRKLAEEVVQAGSTLILADDTLTLARHAVEKGWISPQALAAIASEKKKDEAPPTPLEKVLGEEKEPPAGTRPVEVKQPSKAETTASIRDGAVEEALEKGKEDKTKSPGVIIEPDEPAKSRREDDDQNTD